MKIKASVPGLMALSLAVAPMFVAQADDPPADVAATVSANVKAVGKAVKRDAKAVAEATKEGAQQVAVAAEEVARDVAVATKEGAQEVAAAAKRGAENSKAAVTPDKTDKSADKAGKGDTPAP